MTSEEILTDIRKIIRALNLESKRIQKEFGISIPQLLCMNHLHHSPTFQANTTELSEALNLNPSTITGIVRRLEKKGYLARLPRREDRRVNNITLTADGARVLEKTPTLFHEKLDQRLSQLSPREVEVIKEGLSLITQMLELTELDAAPMLAVNDNLALNTTETETAEMEDEL